MIVVAAAEMQTMDRQTIEEFGIPGRVLMENAGRGATRCFLQQVFKDGPGRVGILAGRGNNGGDGFVIARYLAERQLDVRVYLLTNPERLQGDAAANFHLLSALGVPVRQISDPDAFTQAQKEMRHTRYWIDAILGTGLKSEVRGHFRNVIQFINQQQRPVLAVDIPSGLNADTGQPCGICIQAEATATFGFAKIGHLLHPGAQYCGLLEVIDIGIPGFVAAAANVRQKLITARQIETLLGYRPPDSHKGRTGHLLVVAGSTGKTGAAAMTAMAALRCGAGLVTLGVLQSLNPILEAQLIEAMTLPLAESPQGSLSTQAFDAIRLAAEGKQCVALGPGLGTAPQTRDLVRRMIQELDLPMVIDADGLNNLAGSTACLEGRRAPTVLTPHPGEMARLTKRSVPQIQADRVSAARDMATRLGVHLVLKGARTVVAAPDGQIWINATGNPGMASGGMGDVLTGLIAGLMAQGCGPAEASQAGVYLHGLAADILAADAPRGYLATEVMHAIPRTIERVLHDPPPPTVQSALY